MFENTGVSERCMVRLAIIRDGYKVISSLSMAYDWRRIAHTLLSL